MGKLEMIRVFAGPACGRLEESVVAAEHHLRRLMQQLTQLCISHERARGAEELRFICRLYGSLCADRADYAGDWLQQLGNELRPQPEISSVLREEIAELRRIAQLTREHEDHAPGMAPFRMPRGPRQRERWRQMAAAASAAASSGVHGSDGGKSHQIVDLSLDP